MSGVSTVECPECGQQIPVDKDSIEKHIKSTWFQEPKLVLMNKNPDVVKRATFLLAAIPGGHELLPEEVE